MHYTARNSVCISAQIRSLDPKGVTRLKMGAAHEADNARAAQTRHPFPKGIAPCKTRSAPLKASSAQTDQRTLSNTLTRPSLSTTNYGKPSTCESHPATSIQSMLTTDGRGLGPGLPASHRPRDLMRVINGWVMTSAIVVQSGGGTPVGAAVKEAIDSSGVPTDGTSLMTSQGCEKSMT
jgi:hypothetical protein